MVNNHGNRKSPKDRARCHGDLTWRIIPLSKWLITMVIVSPLNGVVGPLTNGRTSWLINGGDPNHLRYLG